MINIKAILGLSYYTSPLEEFLAEYNKKHPKLSHSQRKEMQKYARIYALRDKTDQQTPEKSFWDKF